MNNIQIMYILHTFAYLVKSIYIRFENISKKSLRLIKFSEISPKVLQCSHNSFFPDNNSVKKYKFASSLKVPIIFKHGSSLSSNP